MSRQRLLLSAFSFVSVYPCSKFIMASLAVDTKVPGFDEKGAAKKNEEEIFAALTGEQLESITTLKSKMSEDKLKRWPVAGERMALYRFLKARDFDVDMAFTMLDNHLDWRAKTYPIKKSEWVNDPFFKAGACIPNSGFDSQGRPLLVMKSGRFPVAERNLENTTRGMIAVLTELATRYGAHARFTVLYDRQGFDRSTNFDKDLLKNIAGVLSDNSPESLENGCLYPCGLILRGIWQIVKWFFDYKTREKIVMLGGPEAFFDYVPEDQLMTDMGGKNDFVWPVNSEEMWKKQIFDYFPDETVDNWQDPNYVPEDAKLKA